MTFQIREREIILSKIKKINRELNLSILEDSKLILDFSKVEMMDSEGISWIVSILNKLDKREIDLEIINVRKEVYRIFKITMLDTIMNIKVGI